MYSDGFLTTDEVLAYLQVNLRTVYRLIKAGKLPAVRVGRQWRFRKRDVDAWLEGARSRGTPRPAPILSLTGVADSSRPRVLVVDQEPDAVEPLVKALESSNYQVDVAPDGRTALERLRHGACDLVITELRVTGMDGLSLIREGRRVKPHLPAIIVTSYSTEGAAIEAANLGVAGYFTRPFGAARLLAVAAGALGKQVVQR